MNSVVGVEQTLPPYFPLKLRKCAIPADTFFACFEVESAPNGDVLAGRKALATCSKQLELYKQCMDKFVGPKAKKESKGWFW
ncbi:hypothetical protein BC833DRAFT_583960, partial [Globomyces pollinis-pini]